MDKKLKERKDRLLPAGVPRYIRCYDNGGPEVFGRKQDGDKRTGTIDRYTVVYTGNYSGKARGWFDYVGMSGSPFQPQGFGQHGQSEFQPVDRPTYSHLGKKIKFTDLPKDCQTLVMRDYLYYWGFTDENGKPLK